MTPKYKRMLAGMVRKEKIAKKRVKRNWSVYILRCSDGSLYAGATNDIKRRLKAHYDGKAARYTRPRRPVVLVYQQNNMSRSRALVRECAIKALSKRKKEDLVSA